MRKNKFNARRTSCGSHMHASKKEAIRCGVLQTLLKARMIRNLVQQPVFDLCGVKYVADFQYEEQVRDPDIGALHPMFWPTVVEDVKGSSINKKGKRWSTKTAAYRLKKKLMLNIHGITIRET